jgi:ABC-2 type transport system ATP-binding protein
MIRLHRVTRTYGRRAAVSGLDLQVRRGELFAFLGPNGAGKTTTIKMLVGLLKATSGRITLGGIDVAVCPREASLLVGYVPDQPYLYDKLSGREFLDFIARMYGLPADEAAANTERRIAAFELAPFIDQLAESYSHGMKQRLAFAAAMVHAPPILIVDEPMVGLDPRSTRFVKDLLRAEARRGTTVFISTHTLSVAEEIADRIGIIDRGQLKFLGSVDELRTSMALAGSSLENLFLALTSDGPPPQPSTEVDPTRA